jgi:CRP-like cAMP-binding protein
MVQIPAMTSFSSDPYALPHRDGAPDQGQTALRARLVDHPFLRGLEPAHLEVLAANAMPVEIPAGEVIFREGDNANRFYLIHEGEVVIESPGDATGAPVLIEKLGDGDVLGWSWMFPPYYWHFDARATRSTRATFFYGTRLREACNADPRLGFALSQRVAEVAIHRLQATRKKLVSLTPAAIG